MITLSIDDQPEITMLMRRMLTSIDPGGIHMTASDINEARDLLTDDVQIIFLDIEMPGLNGIDFAKRIAEGKKKENKHDDSLPYLPHNDRDVFQLTAQLALINRMEIHSIADIDAKSKELEEKTKKLTDEFNSITVRHSETEKLLQQSELYNELSAKDRLSLSDKMRLQIIKQTLSHHDALDERGIERLTKEYHDLDERITALKAELESCENLKISYQEIKDTYNGISKGNYISKLVERDNTKDESDSQEPDFIKQNSINEIQNKKKPKL